MAKLASWLSISSDLRFGPRAHNLEWHQYGHRMVHAVIFTHVPFNGHALGLQRYTCALCWAASGWLSRSGLIHAQHRAGGLVAILGRSMRYIPGHLLSRWKITQGGFWSRMPTLANLGTSTTKHRPIIHESLYGRYTVWNRYYSRVYVYKYIQH